MTLPDPVQAPTPEKKQPLLLTEGLSKRYKMQQGWLKPDLAVHAVNDISISLDVGRTLGIVGESGSGKTTLSRLIAGTVEPSSGNIHLSGEDVSKLGNKERNRALRKVQMVFQSPYSSLNPRMRVVDIVREPLDVHHRQELLAQRKMRAMAMLERVGINATLSERFPHQLSGGQQQRVGIARALVSDVSLVICDEPVSALDVSVQAQVMNLLRDLQETTRVSYIFVSHDLAVVANISHDIAVMYLGRIIEYGKSEDVIASPQHPYSKALVQSANVPDPRIEKTRKPIVLVGEIPKPTSPPSGCHFRTRCWMATDRCAQEQPRLEYKQGRSQQVACHYV